MLDCDWSSDVCSSDLGCAVSFDAPATRLRLPLAALALPLRSPDPLLLEMMERQAGQHLQRVETADGFERSVRGRITRLLREGTPDVDSVAAGLHTTTRTLHRRLAERGWNYQRLLADTRHRLAEDYLANPRLQLAEIALLLGYSEQSAFNRAYRQWTGRTPLQARRAARA
jgi:AraC-like DNA-binding protein